jgi:FlaG/FlaF family flagellin (archaellin)
MKHRLVLVLAIVGLVVYAGSAAAGAAPFRGSQPRAASGGQDCVASALPAGDTSPPPMTCYSTFAAAIAAATGGRVHLPASATPRTVSIGQINAGASPDTTYVLSIDYKNANFQSPSLTWTQSQQCGSYQASSMPTGWNDVVSSVATYSGCANTQYKNVNFGGATFSIGRNSQAATMGSFNDSTSSEKWCTAKPC